MDPAGFDGTPQRRLRRKQAALSDRPPMQWTVVGPPRTEAKDEALLLDAETTLNLLGGDAQAVADAVARALNVEPGPADADGDPT